MAKTLARFEGPGPDQPLNRKHPFEGLGRLMEVFQENGKWGHRASRSDSSGRPVVSVSFPVQYSIGSGSHGLSYLTIRDGFVFQTFVSWYSQKKIWDVSPGFDDLMLAGRPVGPDCLYCHANRVEPLPGYHNRYEEPIFRGHGVGRERCHGPGEIHKLERERGDPLPDGPHKSIVNPAHLKWQLRNAICEQCHLQGEERVLRRGRKMFDWRPGLPMEDFRSVFVADNRAEDNREANNHVEQMYQSRCFQKSDDEWRSGVLVKRKLGCVSCHDPHVHVPKEKRAEHYRARCLQCHQNKGCRIHLADRWRLSPGDSCIDCHMPRHPAADIVHTALTNHRIHRRPPPQREVTDLPVNLGNFYRDRLEAGDPETQRDLAIALSRQLRPNHPHLRRDGPRAIGILSEAAEAGPRRCGGERARGELLRFLGCFGEALADYDKVLRSVPTRELSLRGAMLSAQADGLRSTSRDYQEQLTSLSPYRVAYREGIARILIDAGEPAEALVQASAWLNLEPTSLPARVMVFRLLLRTKRKAEAKVELEVLRRLQPANLADLEQAFAQSK